MESRQNKFLEIKNQNAGYWYGLSHAVLNYIQTCPSHIEPPRL